MDKLDYISKMKLILCDRTKFQPAHHNNNLQQHQKYQQFLARLKKRKAIVMRFTSASDLFLHLLLRYAAYQKSTKTTLHFDLH